MPSSVLLPPAPRTTASHTPAPSRFSDAERDALVHEHLGLVHHVARRLRRRLGGAYALKELVSAGTLGLLQAIEAFDASRGLAFSTFAAPRIRGAILDELRRHDDAPRDVRRRGRELDAARDALTAAAGRPPSDAELAAHLGVDVATLWTWQRKVAGATHARLDAPTNRADRATNGRPATGAGALLELVTPEAEAPDAALLRRERVRVLGDAILALKAQQRAVLGLYYFERAGVAQIARVLEVSESRVSQIHKQALRTLRETLHAPLGLAA